MSTFVVVGESLVDIVVPADGSPPHNAVGGSCLNVAVGLARLDVPTTLVTRSATTSWARSSSSTSGQRRHGLPGVGGPRWRDQHRDRPARRGQRRVVRVRPGVGPADADLPEGTTGVHVGSLGASLLPGRAAVVDLVRRAVDAELFVSYDPNIRPAFLEDTEAAWADVLEIAAAHAWSSCPTRTCGAPPRRGRGGGLPRPAGRRPHRAGGADPGAQGATAFTEGATVPSLRRDGFVDSVVRATRSWPPLRDALGLGRVADGRGAVEALDEDRVRLLVQGAATAAAITCSRRGANPPTRRELPPTWPAG